MSGLFKGLLPTFHDDKSKVLILGSFPSVKSRGHFYYGNKQNRFWKMLACIFEEEVPADDGSKEALLVRHNIVLWDVLESCNIVGSRDDKITDEKFNDIEGLLNECQNIETIIINGGKAAELFKKKFAGLQKKVIYMGSTSSRNKYFNQEEWKNALRTALE